MEMPRGAGYPSRPKPRHQNQRGSMRPEIRLGQTTSGLLKSSSRRRMTLMDQELEVGGRRGRC